MTLAEIIWIAPQAEGVFKALKMDHLDIETQFEQACVEARVLPGRVKEDLKRIRVKKNRYPEIPKQHIPSLVNHMITKHHLFVKESIERIRKSIGKVMKQYGSCRLELANIEILFDKIATSLELHMYAEENIVFPAIQNLALQEPSKTEKKVSTFRLLYPLEVMEKEHEAIDAYFNKIRSLNRGYKVPKGTDRSFHILYSQLQQLETNLKKIIQLENLILFPAALQLDNDSFST